MNTLIPGAPLRSLSPTSIEYQRAQGASRAAKPARAARFTLDAPEHSGTQCLWARGDILPPGVALTSNLAVIFTLNQYSLVRSLRRSASAFTCRSVPCFPSCAVLALFTVGDVYVSLCKKGAYALFSAQRRSRALFWL